MQSDASNMRSWFTQIQWLNNLSLCSLIHAIVESRFNSLGDMITCWNETDTTHNTSSSNWVIYDVQHIKKIEFYSVCPLIENNWCRPGLILPSLSLHENCSLEMWVPSYPPRLIIHFCCIEYKNSTVEVGILSAVHGMGLNLWLTYRQVLRIHLKCDNKQCLAMKKIYW